MILAAHTQTNKLGALSKQYHIEGDPSNCSCTVICNAYDKQDSSDVAVVSDQIAKRRHGSQEEQETAVGTSAKTSNALR